MSATQTASISILLNQATQQLSSRLEAELLMAQALQVNRSYLMVHAHDCLTPQALQDFKQLLARRLQGEPMAYIAGEKEFWSLSLKTSPATLIPRPDTETLVETVLATLDAQLPLEIADLGTGTGAIALALAKERPNWRLTATDKSLAALADCEANRQALGLSNVRCYSGDWCQALPHRNYDAIVSNPPYIADADPHLEQGDLRFEPKQALIAGPDGLAAFRQIIPESIHYLKPGGWLFFEHGYDQAEALNKLLTQAGFSNIKMVKDLANQPRVTTGRKELA